MALLPLIILAIIQGLTEFLPVSSSGHLVLFHAMNGDAHAVWDENLVMDTAVHVGTLFSVLVYFWRDLWAMVSGFFGYFKTRTPEVQKNVHVVTCILIASLPVIVAGFIMHAIKPDFLRSLEVMAWMTIIFGVILGVADCLKPREKTVETLTFKNAIFVGLAQILALIPGVSRSGITMTAGRFTGLSPVESARFSLFLSIVAIAGAGTLAIYDLLQSGDVTLGIEAVLAAMFAFVFGLMSIAVMMRWLDTHGFMPFVIYRVILGAVLLGFIYGGIVPA